MWTHENTTELVNLYQQHECLYQVQHINYKNKSKRKAAINAIAGQLSRSLELPVVPESVLKKINGLRTTFMQEIQKIKKSKASGCGSTEVYVPTWWCFDLLTFLGNCSTAEKGESNFINTMHVQASNDSRDKDLVYEGTVDDFNDGQFDIDSLVPPSRSNSPHLVTPKVSQKRKRANTNTLEDIGKEFLKDSAAAMKQFANNKVDQIEDHISTFSQCVEKELRLIKGTDKLQLVKSKIMNIIFDSQDL